MGWWSRRVPLGAARVSVTTAFEDTTAWLVCDATLSVVAVCCGWRGAVCPTPWGRVVAAPSWADRLAGLRRIGIDEISYRKGQRYLLVVPGPDGAGSPRSPSSPRAPPGTGS